MLFPLYPSVIIVSSKVHEVSPLPLGQGKAELVLRSKGRRGVGPERISANLSPTISSQPVGMGSRPMEGRTQTGGNSSQI